MTLDQLDKLIDSRASLDGRPVIEFTRLPQLMGFPQGSWWTWTKDLTPEELPKSLFRAGGARMVTMDDARQWCRWFIRRDPSIAKSCGVTE